MQLQGTGLLEEAEGCCAGPTTIAFFRTQGAPQDPMDGANLEEDFKRFLNLDED